MYWRWALTDLMYVSGLGLVFYIAHCEVMALGTTQITNKDPNDGPTASLLKAKKSDQIYLRNFAMVSCLMS